MATATTELTSHLPDLSDGALGAFCEDISGMFGVEVTCERRHVGTETVADLRRRFKKLSVVHVVQAEGILDGTLHLFFDQGGLFTLSGVIVMLPERRILEEIKRGSIADAENLQDAAREVGNLLVGSWDRVFREDCRGHKHFVKKSTVIGKPNEAAAEVELSEDEQVLLVVYEMTVDPYPSFTCAAVFPQRLLPDSAAGASEPAGEAEAPAPEAARQDDENVVDAESEKAPSATPPSQETPAERDATLEAQDDGKKPATSAEPPGDDANAPKAGAPRADGDVQDAAVETTRQGDEAEIFGLAGGSDPVFLDPSYVQTRPSSTDGAVAELLRTPAAEIMQKNVVWGSPEDSVQDTIAAMQQHDTGYVLVGQNGVLEGLVSGSNILGAVSLYLRPMFAKYRRSEDEATLNVKIKWIMSRPVRTVRPDTPLSRMMEMICHHGGHCLPVVNEKAEVQGIVTVLDVFMHVLNADGSFSWKGPVSQAPPFLV
jgi:CBS domain-containing protein